MKKEQGEGEAPPVLTFDKDDEDTLDFVAASANLRSLVFGIEVKSKFDIKRMFLSTEVVTRVRQLMVNRNGREYYSSNCNN